MPQFIDTTGNLLDAEVDALVNTVNTVGVMGKGIALDFKHAYPQNFSAYKRACDADQVKPGMMFVFDNCKGGTAERQPTAAVVEAVPLPGFESEPETGAGTDNRRWIINFPTKRHWRNSSRIEDIAEGLDDLREWIEHLQVRSVAMPPLGCGNGGLHWTDVRPLIEERLAGLSRDVTIHLFAPFEHAGSARTPKVTTPTGTGDG